jgi:hypothetical protein
MATILLSAAGATAGASLGGSILGLSTAVAGRTVGATLGRVIDQRVLGNGSDAIETGRVDRFQLVGASEGAPIPRVFGRMRVAGQVIWATRFRESSETDRAGGKGGGPEVKSYGYSISLAIALCEGEIRRIGRIWADGNEIAAADLSISVYRGTADQQPDPKMEAVEGAGNVPSYGGLAYVVIEDLDLGAYGNRVPQLTFEVLRPAVGAEPPAPAEAVRAVAMVPGTGEYGLSTRQLNVEGGPGEMRAVNVSTARAIPDFVASMNDLTEELPNVGSVSLVVSWFGSDLRCGECRVVPKVETADGDAREMEWRVAGRSRGEADLIGRDAADRPIYGGTPADASVIEAIREIRGRGLEAMFYPFILMEPQAGNDLPDPYTGAPGQPPLPWRGRITTSRAPGLPGSPDGTAAAAAEVDAFFGAARASDFVLDGETVGYQGVEDGGYARFILHYAWLCRAAGGVDAFCIGSEMRGLTWIRGADGSYPAVARMVGLLREVRSVLGAECDLSYAADWSEYSGHRPEDAPGDVRFHLDPLWADPDCDFVAIDNYLPLTDWRDEPGHADEAFGSIHDLDYLKSGVLGGEYYDWFYADEADMAAQVRTPITDGAGEPWVWRVKDLRGWWENAHHDRIGGARQAAPTAWVPGGKPIRFTEYGCAAIDKATNQPNVFLDPKSSESLLPRKSTGRRDELLQHQYIRAVNDFWSDPEANPVSPVYGAPMLDLDRAHLWAWDARPWPAFPGRTDLWTDGPNYARGHWLNGRTASRTLRSVVREICTDAGVEEIDVTTLAALVRGYALSEVGPARAALQPLLLAYGVDVVERDGRLVFRHRDGVIGERLDPGLLALSEIAGERQTTRAAEAELPERVRLTYVEGEGTYETRVADARMPGVRQESVAESELPLALTEVEARTAAERWLAETRIGREVARFALGPSRTDLGAGDVVGFTDREDAWRIDRVDDAGARMITAVRVDPAAYRPVDAEEVVRPARTVTPATPVVPVFMDLPLLQGDEPPHAPRIAVAARPWPGKVAILSSDEDAGYGEAQIVDQPAVIGVTETTLAASPTAIWDRGAPLRVRMGRGGLSSAGDRAVLNGRNALAIGDGGPQGWEILQFRHAEAVGDGIWDLSVRLRGQLGTDADMAPVRPAGSTVVLLNEAVDVLDFAPRMRGVERHYRTGPGARPLDDATYRHDVLTFEGIGLRPYPPAHVRADEADGGDLRFTWIRRTRIDGDPWGSADVPLGEIDERYVVRVMRGGLELRRVEVSTPSWTYAAEDRAADGAGGTVEVAQTSDRYGPGGWARHGPVD